MNTIEKIRQISNRSALFRAARLSCIWLVLIITGIFMLAAWDTFFPMQLQALAIIKLLLVVVFCGGILHALMGFFKKPSHLKTAAALENASPNVGQQLRTAWEVSEGKSTSTRSAEYDQLAATLMKNSAVAMERLDAAPVLGRKKTFLAVALLMLAAVGFIYGSLNQSTFALSLKRCAGLSKKTHTQLQWVNFPDYHDDRHSAHITVHVEGKKVKPTVEILAAGEKNWRALELTALQDGVGYDVILTGVETSLQVRARAGDSELAVRTLPWIVIPRLLELKTKIIYPDYTQLPPTEHNGGDINSVDGSLVFWSMRFNHRPAKMTWKLGDEEPFIVATDLQNRGEVRWNGHVSQHTATLSIFDENGRSLDTWKFDVKIFPDNLPSIELLDPAKDMEATSVTEFPVRIRARDDFGLAEVGLIMDAAGNREWVLEQTIEVKNDKDINDVVSVMLEKVPLSIRDNVRLHAYALDHKPRGGPRAVSPLLSIDIKDFKPRSEWLGSASEEGAKANAEAKKNEQRNKKINELIGKMDQIVKRQREFTSSVFQYSQNGVNPEAAANTKLYGEEDIIFRSIKAFYDDFLSSAIASADDLALLSAAADQAKSSAQAVLIPDMDNAFFEGDAALASLLQLRKSLVERIQKSKSPGEKPKHQAKDIKDLAREARRLAKEEVDIRNQLNAKPDERALQAARRQQEVALSDGGELFSEIVAHHERSDGAMELMSQSEKLMQAADDVIHKSDPSPAIPTLVDAAVRLNELADFLESMDLNQVPKTLKKLAEEAAESQKKALEAQADQPKEGEGEKEKIARQAEQQKAAQQAERKAELAHKALKQLVDDLTARDGEENEDVKKLKDILRKNDLGMLKEKAGEWKKAEQEGREPDAHQNAGDVAKGMEKFGADLLAEAERREASLLQKLAEAKKQAGELKKQLAGEKAKDGEKPGEGKGENPGEGKGEKPGEGKGEKPSEGMAKGEGDKNGKGEGSPNGKGDANGKSGKIATDVGRFSGGLANLGDEELDRIAGDLRNGTFDKNSLPLIEMAESRIDKLIAEIPRPDNDAVVRNRVPESSRREIEDYYRDLSNDTE